MAKYLVTFLEEADDEVLRSYEWGLAVWGKERADKWLISLYQKVIRRLSEFPFSCPIAPESRILKTEIRHYIFGRYRILFKIEEDEVIILRLVGPFIDFDEDEAID